MMGHLVKLHICVDQSVAVYCLQTFYWGRTSGALRNFFFGEGVQQIQLRTEDRENGDLGAVAP